MVNAMFPFLIAELPDRDDKELWVGSQYSYDKEPAEAEFSYFGRGRLAIPSHLGSAKSLVVAFDIQGEGYHYETYDLTDGQKILDWFNSPECTGE